MVDENKFISVGEVIELEGREYFCFEDLEMSGKKYLCLVTVDEPNEVCFAEQVEADGRVQVRIVGGHEEKMEVIEGLKQK